MSDDFLCTCICEICCALCCALIEENNQNRISRASREGYERIREDNDPSECPQSHRRGTSPLRPPRNKNVPETSGRAEGPTDSSNCPTTRFLRRRTESGNSNPGGEWRHPAGADRGGNWKSSKRNPNISPNVPTRSTSVSGICPKLLKVVLIKIRCQSQKYLVI